LGKLEDPHGPDGHDNSNGSGKLNNQDRVAGSTTKTGRAGWIDDLNEPDRPNDPNGRDQSNDPNGPDQPDDSNVPICLTILIGLTGPVIQTGLIGLTTLTGRAGLT